MKITHISTADIVGGAARSAYRLHTGLRALGHDSTLFVEKRVSNDPSVVGFISPSVRLRGFDAACAAGLSAEMRPSRRTVVTSATTGASIWRAF